MRKKSAESAPRNKSKIGLVFASIFALVTPAHAQDKIYPECLDHKEGYERESCQRIMKMREREAIEAAERRVVQERKNRESDERMKEWTKRYDERGDWKKFTQQLNDFTDSADKAISRQRLRDGIEKGENVTITIETSKMSDQEFRSWVNSYCNKEATKLAAFLSGFRVKSSDLRELRRRDGSFSCILNQAGLRHYQKEVAQ